MCTNRRYISNPYTGERILRPCGVCPACLQQKANASVQRIINSTRKDEVICFCTLTYSNENVPYIKRSDLRTGFLPVYRGAKRIDSVYIEYDENDQSIVKLSDLTNAPGKIGIIYYPDLQKFVKRFRDNYQRHYNENEKLKYFVCSEYGSENKRPHFHMLFWCKRTDFYSYRDTFFKTWKMHDLCKIDASRVFEMGVNPAAYVASYVNCAHSLPGFLKQKSIRQSKRMSRGVGVDTECFTLPNLEKFIDRNDLRYNIATVRDGVPCTTSVLVPKYVINRYFPRFKGYNRLAPDEIYDVVRRPAVLSKYGKRLHYVFDPKFRINDYHRERVKLNNAYKRWLKSHGYIDTPINHEIYAMQYSRAWAVYQATVLRQFYDDPFRNELQSYDNIGELAYGGIRNETLEDMCALSDSVETDYNRFASVVRKSRSLEELYWKKDKAKKVNGYVNAQINPYF